MCYMKYFVILFLCIWYAHAAPRSPATLDSFKIYSVVPSLSNTSDDCNINFNADGIKNSLANLNAEKYLINTQDIAAAYGDLMQSCLWKNNLPRFFDYHLGRIISKKFLEQNKDSKIPILDDFTNTYNRIYADAHGLDSTLVAKLDSLFLDPYWSIQIKPTTMAQCGAIDMSELSSLSQTLDPTYVCTMIQNLRWGCVQWFWPKWIPLFGPSNNWSASAQANLLCQDIINQTRVIIDKKVDIITNTIRVDHRERQWKVFTDAWIWWLNILTTRRNLSLQEFMQVAKKNQCKEK